MPIKYFIKNNRVNPLLLCHDSNKDIKRKFGSPIKETSKLVKIAVPYHMVLSWDTDSKVKTIRCNKHVAGALESMLNEFKKHPNLIQILGLNLYGGCHNYRKIRGGNKLSSHSWGISIDLNTQGNPFRANPRNTTLGKYPELATIYGNIIYRYGFRTLEFDLMHLQYVG